MTDNTKKSLDFSWRSGLHANSHLSKQQYTHVLTPVQQHGYTHLFISIQHLYTHLFSPVQHLYTHLFTPVPTCSPDILLVIVVCQSLFMHPTHTCTETCVTPVHICTPYGGFCTLHLSLQSLNQLTHLLTSVRTLVFTLVQTLVYTPVTSIFTPVPTCTPVALSVVVFRTFHTVVTALVCTRFAGSVTVCTIQETKCNKFYCNLTFCKLNTYLILTNAYLVLWRQNAATNKNI